MYNTQYKCIIQTMSRQTIFKAIMVEDSVRQMFISRKGDKTTTDYLLELMKK